MLCPPFSYIITVFFVVKIYKELNYPKKPTQISFYTQSFSFTIVIEHLYA